MFSCALQDVQPVPRKKSWSCGDPPIEPLVSCQEGSCQQEPPDIKNHEADRKQPVATRHKGKCKPCVFFASQHGCADSCCQFCHCAHCPPKLRPGKQMRDSFKAAVEHAFQQKQAFNGRSSKFLVQFSVSHHTSTRIESHSTAYYEFDSRDFSTASHGYFPDKQENMFQFLSMCEVFRCVEDETAQRMALQRLAMKHPYLRALIVGQIDLCLGPWVLHHHFTGKWHLLFILFHEGTKFTRKVATAIEVASAFTMLNFAGRCLV